MDHLVAYGTLELPLCRDDLLRQVRIRETLPAAMEHAVIADGHSGLNERVGILARQKPGAIEAVRDQEELRPQSTLQQPGKGDRDVRGIPIVERQSSIGSFGDQGQQLLEEVYGDPNSILTRIEPAGASSDAVNSQVDHL